MRKTVFFIAALFVLACLSLTKAYAQTSRLYFSGYMGLNTHNQESFSESTVPTGGSLKVQNAFSFAGALGLRLTSQLRVEGEVSYRKADMDRIDFNAGGGDFELGGDLKTWLVMLNGYYDFDFEWDHIEPFISAGIGLARHNGNIAPAGGPAPGGSGDDFGFAWQAGGGLKYRMNPGLAFTGGYRYLSTSDISLGSYDFGYSSHEIRLGVEYDLPVNMFLK